MKRNLFIIAILFVVLSVAACGDASENEVNTSETAIAVRLQKAEPSEGVASFSAPAQLEASRMTTLSTRMSGFIDQVHVKVGDRVNKNQLLVSLNSADLNAQKAQVNASIQKAKENLAATEKDFNRFARLFETQSITEKEFDDMSVRFKMAQSDMEQAVQKHNEINAQFEYINVKAPFAGVVTADFVEAGDLANPGAPLLSLESQNTLDVVTLVAESNISNINADMPVRVTIPALATNLSGSIVEMSASASQSGGQFMVKVRLEATEQPILPGMYAQVNFTNGSALSTTSVFIPESAVVHQGQLTGVYTVSQDQKALLRWIRLGSTEEGKVEVLSGLSPNESFIADADAKLFNGASVKVQQ